MTLEEDKLKAQVKLLQSELSAQDEEIDSLKRKVRAEDGDVENFIREKHTLYVLDFWKKEKENKDTFEMLAIEHIRMQGVFWALGALQILEKDDLVDKGAIVEWVLSCFNKESGGFSGNKGHDTNLINTQFAVYVLLQCGALDKVDADKVAGYVAAKQQEETGCFADEFSGEKDLRYTCCALFCLKMLNKLNVINVSSAVGYVLSCQNSDGGFGQVPGAESHAAFTYCALGSLKAADHELGLDKADKLAWWLCERQCLSGGLNGRIEKQSDVCYSFWALASLKMLRRIDWIDQPALVEFILTCQDEDAGGIADRPGNVSDLFHTFFGLCGLELLHAIKSDVQISPIYALPIKCLPF